MGGGEGASMLTREEGGGGAGRGRGAGGRMGVGRTGMRGTLPASGGSNGDTGGGYERPLGSGGGGAKRAGSSGGALLRVGCPARVREAEVKEEEDGRDGREGSAGEEGYSGGRLDVDAECVCEGGGCAGTRRNGMVGASEDMDVVGEVDSGGKALGRAESGTGSDIAVGRSTGGGGPRGTTGAGRGARGATGTTNSASLPTCPSAAMRPAALAVAEVGLCIRSASACAGAVAAVRCCGLLSGGSTCTVTRVLPSSTSCGRVLSSTRWLSRSQASRNW